MLRPPSLEDKDLPNHVCTHQKALYGLKQVRRASFSHLSSFLYKFGFQWVKTDTLLFILKENGVVIYVIVYAD